jgi:hypothetical protein
MIMKPATLFLASFLGLCACGIDSEPRPVSSASSADKPVAAGANAPSPTPNPDQNQPKTIRDFFTLLPEKYFVLEGCDRETDKDCKKARADYLKTFTEVEDIANGYFKGGCDGGQSCIEMAIFKRPDATYLVGVATFAEMMNDFYFLDFADGKWSDVSADAVPEFSKKNWYELPRVGTTMKVYSKKIVEKTVEFEISEKGNQLYALMWKDGKFVKAK